MHDLEAKTTLQTKDPIPVYLVTNFQDFSSVIKKLCAIKKITDMEADKKNINPPLLIIFKGVDYESDLGKYTQLVKKKFPCSWFRKYNGLKSKKCFDLFRSQTQTFSAINCRIRQIVDKVSPIWGVPGQITKTRNLDISGFDKT